MPGPFQRRTASGRGSAVYERLRGTYLANDTLPEAAARADNPGKDSPWHHFSLAARAVEAHEEEEAKGHLRAVLALPKVESRPCLQAWYSLRALGEMPPEEEARRVLGVVVEVFVEDGGLDAVAAYRDTSARYFNHSGAAVIWGRFMEGEDVDEPARLLLKAGQELANSTTPYPEGMELPLAPQDGGVARVFALSPGGMHVRKGPMGRLGDGTPAAGYIVRAAYGLMQALMERGRS